MCEVWRQEFLGCPCQHADLKILRDSGYQLSRNSSVVGKSNGSHHFIWKASENEGCDLRFCNNYFLLSLACSADFDILYTM